MENAIPRYRTLRQRYSATRPDSVDSVDVLYLGLQLPAADEPATRTFLDEVAGLFAAPDGPVHHDYARFVDPEGCPTVLAVAYWMDPAACARWGDCAWCPHRGRCSSAPV